VNSPIVITEDNADQFFRFERLAVSAPIGDFECHISGEYTDYLREEALHAQADHVALIVTDAINPYCAVRFITVDADIEHDSGVLAFYEKLGFVPNAELSGKHRKTVSMRLDLYS